ncbi:MAG TPA: hypothetical protein VI543_02540 [Sulfuricaulis sp.]|jgi:hypothetical protein|nr:hypothetical protein [Sulfuricaulis sp.]
MITQLRKLTPTCSVQPYLAQLENVPAFRKTNVGQNNYRLLHNAGHDQRLTRKQRQGGDNGRTGEYQKDDEEQRLVGHARSLRNENHRADGMSAILIY